MVGLRRGRWYMRVLWGATQGPDSSAKSSLCLPGCFSRSGAGIARGGHAGFLYEMSGGDCRAASGTPLSSPGLVVEKGSRQSDVEGCRDGPLMAPAHRGRAGGELASRADLTTPRLPALLLQPAPDALQPVGTRRTRRLAHRVLATALQRHGKGLRGLVG